MISAHIRLADHYFIGRGFYPSLPDAFEHYQIAAKHRDPYSQYMLSIFYLRGMGVPYCLEQSVYWYNQAQSQSGHAQALYEVGRLYQLGLGFKKNVKEAMEWFTLSAKDGYSIAQNELGELYYKGRDTKRNYKLAMDYFRKAAAQRLPLAQYNIGLMYYNGDGVRMNQSKAMAWFKLAAKQRAEYAQFLIGEMYEAGIGVKRNLPQAFAWKCISADHRFELMDKILAEILWDMTPAENKEALALADEYSQYENPNLIEDKNN